MGLQIKNLVKNFGDYRALDNINFDIKEGQFVTLLGPSGCGKTTLLRSIAGFIEPDSGEIIYNGETLNEVPPNKRNTAMCFQSYALFPHKTVYENVRFGLRMRKVPEEDQKTRIAEALALVNLTGLEHRKPYELSGGQQQRVALARAIVVRPNILLFDEPLSNLDAKLREKVRVEIRDVQQKLGIMAVYVTHDQAEALAISDIIISMNKGVIQQIASPKEIYDNPTRKFVADFIGTANHLEGTVKNISGDNIHLDTVFGELISCHTATNVKVGQTVDICFRPEDMILETDEHSDKNIIKGTVTHSVYMGNMLDIFFEFNGKSYRANIDKDNNIKEGSSIKFSVDFKKLHVMEV